MNIDVLYTVIEKFPSDITTIRQRYENVTTTSINESTLRYHLNKLVESNRVVAYTDTRPLGQVPKKYYLRKK